MSLSRFGALLLALSSAPAVALEPFVIKDIRIEGIQRTEAGTVFSYLPAKVGDTMTDEKATQAIRALYGTGFFKDVSVEADNGVLVIVVQERPSVAQIDFVGMKEFEKDTVLKVLRQAGLAEGRIFDKGLLDRAEQEMKQQYLSRGRYGVAINTTVTPLERNRVSINFNVNEGEVTKIRQISIIGANVFKEKDLLDLFSLRTPGLMTWYTKSDQYSRQKLAGDLETLRSYYLDRGYLEFNVDSTQVSITPDKQDIYITVSITEGPQYKVGDIKIAGELLLPEEEVRKLILLKPGDVFSRQMLTDSSKAISDKLGNDGYAFANVNAAPDLDKQKRLASFTFLIDPGRRVYVRRVNLAGNTRTRDEVIRREVRQMEGAWYSGEKIALSKRRVDKLGYFTEVNVETPAVPGATDQVDLNLNVVERPTGNILLGIGFGSGEGLILSGSIAQHNIFGTGKHLAAQVNSSKLNTIYSLSFTDPYYTIDGVSRGFDIYLREVDALGAGLGYYQTSTLGGALRFGVPITETDTINYGLGYESTKITTYPDSPLYYQDYVRQYGNQTDNVFMTAGWSRDRRDSLIWPTRGNLQRASGEVGTPIGSLEYYKAQYQYQQYYPLSRTYTLMMNGEIGYGESYSSQDFPFFKNFYMGGVNSLRGFRTFTVGPKDAQGNPRGGSHKMQGNVELLMPMPGMGGDRTARLGIFNDIGMVGENYNFSDLRASAGLTVTWVSPMGPLKIAIGKAYMKDPSDRTQSFQFTFGGAF